MLASKPEDYRVAHRFPFHAAVISFHSSDFSTSRQRIRGEEEKDFKKSGAEKR